MNLPYLQNVDLVETMEKILCLNTADFQSNFKYDKELLENNLDKNFLWVCHQSGTQFLEERNMYLSNICTSETFKISSQSNSDALCFLVEPQYIQEGQIMGDLTAVDSENFLKHCRATAQKIENITVTFAHSNVPTEFTFDDFNSNYQSIYARHGSPNSFELQTGKEEQLQWSMAVGRICAFHEATMIPVEEYLEQLALTKIEDYKNIPRYFKRFTELKMELQEEPTELPRDEEEIDR